MMIHLEFFFFKYHASTGIQTQDPLLSKRIEFNHPAKVPLVQQRALSLVLVHNILNFVDIRNCYIRAKNQPVVLVANY